MGVGFVSRFPQVILKFALDGFAASRVVMVDQSCAEPVADKNCLLAGTRFTNRFWKLLLLFPCDEFLRRFERLRLVTYVDDLTIEFTRTAAQLCDTSPVQRNGS